MTSWIVVGTADCPTQKITSLMKQSKDYHHFHEKWQSFATDLSVDQMFIKRLTNQIALGNIQLTGAVSEVIEIWVGTSGSRATLDKLINALTLNDLSSIAELLKNEFQLKSSSWDVPSYYISRTLITRNVLNEALFTEKLQMSGDIFVFAGANHSKLNNILKHQIIENSTRIVQQSSINEKYIILDFPTHFSKIYEKTKCPVHLIRFDEKRDKWIHVKSSGNLSAMRDVIDKSQIQLNETELVDSIDAETHPVCISDSPGMGKSTLLQRIGQHLSKTDNNRRVLFATMNEFVVEFIQNDTNDEDERKASLQRTLNKLFCSNASQTSSLSLKLNSKDLAIELLLDGLDEVTSSNTSFALDLLKYLSTIPSIRIWVTTRPHLLEDVENSLNIFGYNIQEFTKENQVSFLKDFWLSRNKNLVTDRLEQFAKNCLSELNAKVCRKDEDIAGIPLQCLLIGEVYEEQAQEHSVATNPNETWIIQINSLVELYQKLIEKQYRKYKMTCSGNLLTKEQLHRQHIRLAVQLIFPELLNMLPTSFKEDANLNELLKVGLLERSSTVLEPKFVHRTIGEFLIAKFLVQLLNLAAESENQNCLHQFINKVLACKEIGIIFIANAFTWNYLTYYFFKNEICHFMDTLLTESDKVFCFDTHLNFKSLLQACIYGDYFNIFKAVLLPFISNEKSSTQSIFDYKWLYLAIQCSDVRFLRIILDNNPALLDDHEIQARSLHLSVGKGKLAQLRCLLNVSDVRELVTHPNDKTKLVIHECVQSSSSNSSSTVRQKVEILEILLDLNSELLEQLDEDRTTPILCGSIHAELLKELIKRNANVLAKDKRHNTILHAHYWNLDVIFEELTTEKLKLLVKLKNVEGETPLMELIKYHETSLEILSKFKEFGADFNSTNKKGYSVLAVSVLKFRTTETITRLIELGANVHCKRGWKRQSLLHIAAKCGNIDAMQFLETKFKLSVKERDWSCKTPDEYLKEFYQKRGNHFSYQQVNNYMRKYLNLSLSSENKTEMLTTSVERMNVSAVEHFLKDGADFIENNYDKYEIVDNLICYFKLEPGSKILNSFIKSGIIEVHSDSLIVVTDKGKRFLLHWAVEWGGIEMVTLLVDEYKQNVNATDDHGKTPLQCLITRWPFSLRTAIYLLSKGANATVLDGEGNTLLHLAAWGGNKESVRWCLNLGLDVNAANANGESPLLKAASNILYISEIELVGIVNLLCDHGANVLQVDKKGRGVLHHLAGSRYMYEKVLNYFLEKGVDINAVDNERNTPLHIAAHKCSDKSNDDGRAKLLLEKGADKTIRNKNGETPYDIHKLEILKLW